MNSLSAATNPAGPGPKAPFVHDSRVLERAAESVRREQEIESFKSWARLEALNSVYLDDPQTDPTNAPARLGRPMPSDELERKLLRLNPKLRFLHSSLSPTGKKIMAIEHPDGTIEKLFPYEPGIMPERSIMSRRVIDVPDENLLYLRPSGAMFHINRSDLPKHEITPAGVEFDTGGPLPGFKRVSVPWREEVRGWRTVLLRLICLNLIPVTAVERVFGPDNTPEWHGRTGKGPRTRPW